MLRDPVTDAEMAVGHPDCRSPVEDQGPVKQFEDFVEPVHRHDRHEAHDDVEGQDDRNGGEQPDTDPFENRNQHLVYAVEYGEDGFFMIDHRRRLRGRPHDIVRQPQARSREREGAQDGHRQDGHQIR